MTARYEPLFNHWPVRTLVGFAVALASPFVASWYLHAPSGGWVAALTMGVALWLPAQLLTDRYVHKYPQRYFPYLIACHLKGATVMTVIGFVLWITGLVPAASAEVFWLAVLILVLVDFLLSVPRRHERDAAIERPGGETPRPERPPPEPVQVDAAAVLRALPSDTPAPIAAALRAGLPASEGVASSVVTLRDMNDGSAADEAALVVGTLPLNNVNRLNNYLKYCSARVAMGGYFAASYVPMETALARLKARYPAWLYPAAYLWHFVRYRTLPKIPWLDRIYFSPLFAGIDRMARSITGGRDRALTKAEVWGRLAYYGMEVIHESEADDLRYTIAQRVAMPVANRKPSYYAVVALEKVGLDGKVIRLHKIRSMYPFSEFLQKKIFQTHGLSNTGKFRDDFRLTDYGPLIRRSWIDEIPGIFDWLRGDVKLVGMRATSPHFLSLYPELVYRLYIQVKPGLVPPIFDEKTTGFDEIVAIEEEYLTRYLQAPIRTDLLYFWYTFRDIFIRKVRSA